MADELTIDSRVYISSKRASELSGYEQDYIGQLCRAGSIEARRVGGLWYVSEDSLMKYKRGAAEHQPEPPINAADARPDSLVSFDGKGYVSTSRASKITGYTPDYVGQMARAGTIPSKQVGSRWYVEQSSILKHKESKDALLAAVQTQSVGIKPLPAETQHGSADAPLLRYVSDNRELMPIIEHTREETKESQENTEEINTIPIRIIPESQIMAKTKVSSTPISLEPRRSLLPVLLPVGMFTIVIVLSLGFISLKRASTYTSNAESKAVQLASVGSNAVDKFGDVIEIWLIPEIVYKRTN